MDPPPVHPRDPALVTVLAVCLVAALVLVGLPLAYVGGFRAIFLVPLALALTAGLVWLLDPRRGGLTASPDGAPPARWRPWGAAYLLAGTSVLVNGRLAAEHSFADRDPGVYALTARWLVRHHDLTMPPLPGPFAGAPLSAGLTPAPDGGVEFQFVHGLPVVQAVGHWALGELGLYRVPAVLAGVALLAVFGLALELLRPAWAVVATLLLAVSLPFVYVARDGFSESLMLIVLASGCWLLLSARRVESRRRAALAGVLLGTAACARYDFMVYGLPLALVTLWIGTLPRSREPGSWWRSGGRLALLAGLVPGVAIGLLDVIGRSHVYYLTLREPVVQLAQVTATVVVAGVALARPPALARWTRKRWERHRKPLAVAAVASLGLAAALSVMLPLLRTARDPALMVRAAGYFETLQRQDGVQPTDPERTFYEYAGHWIAWYDGWPVLLLAVAGAALLLWRVVRGEARAAEGVVLAFAVVPLALIVAKPSIYPDQPWAARRLIPFALPGVLLLATAAVAWAVQRARAHGTLASRSVLAFGLLALLVPAAFTTGRVAHFQESAGLQRTIDAVCLALPADAAVLVLVEASNTVNLPGVLTAWCGVPASSAPPGAEVPALAAAWRARDRELWAVAGTEAVLRQSGFEPVARGRTVMRHVLRRTLLRAPHRTDSITQELVVGQLPERP